MLEPIVQLDKELFLWLNALGNETWDGLWLFITSKWNSIPLYALILFLSYRQLGIKKTGLLLVSVALMVLVTDQFANFFKYGIQRYRPCHDPDLIGVMRLVKSSCGGKFGYFSAHAANSFAVAIFFGTLLKSQFKAIGILLVVWAVLVAYSRIYIGVHFPLDVLTGSLVGMFLGWLFVNFFLMAIQKLSV